MDPIGAVLPPDVRHHRVRIFFPLSFSSVGVAAVADAEDIDPVAVVVESDAPVADAQTELRRVNSVESLYVASASDGKTVYGSDDAQGDSTIQRGKVRLRLSGQDDAFDQVGSW